MMTVRQQAGLCSIRFSEGRSVQWVSQMAT